MRVFVTGANGYLGNAIARELADAGHDVLGLARTPEKARRVTAAGARAVLGDATEPAPWLERAAACDALVHCIAPGGPEPARTDRAALDALLSVARAGGVHALLYTSGVWSLGATGDVPAGEDAPTDRPAAASAWRVPHEQLVLDAAGDGLATAVIRPGMIWGGRGGLLDAFFASAVERGAAEFVGPGTNRWSCVHLRDVARLYRTIAERRAGGIFHAVDGSAIPVRRLAEAASHAAGRAGAVRSIPLDTARADLGLAADALALDQVVIAPRSVLLGWAPSYEPFPERAPEAFQEWQAP